MAVTKAKPNEQENEIYFMVQQRRLAATRAMNSILSIANAPESRQADWSLFLEYISNMAYCLELMLKVLSGNFKNHDVVDMYRQAFGHEHPNAAFLEALTKTLVSQKYLVRPVGGIENFVPEMEDLFDLLQRTLSTTPKPSGEYRSMRKTSFDVRLSPKVLDYLSRNVRRFHIHPEGWNANLDDYRDQLDWEVDRIEQHLKDLSAYQLDFTMRFDTFSIPWLE